MGFGSQAIFLQHQQRRREMDDLKFYLLACPHCGGKITVLHGELNCQIFRHGAYIKNGRPIPPHATQAECQRLVNEKLIYGCGKPFRFDGEKASICDYI